VIAIGLERLKLQRVVLEEAGEKLVAEIQEVAVA